MKEATPHRTYAAILLSAAVFFTAPRRPAAAADQPPLPAGLDTEESAEPALPAGLGGGTADQPALPAGLGEKTEEPELPSGLDGKADEPGLPEGLADDEDREPPKAKEEAANGGWLSSETLRDLGISGFWEVRGGTWTQPNRRPAAETSIGETRLQLDWEKRLEELTVKFTGDFLYDQAHNHHSNVNLVRGTGWFDLRQLWVRTSPLEFMDLKIGRQVLTWGTGDLLFLNDVFPKDWRSFFIGRDLEYLKAPADAVRASFFTDIADFDIVYIPRFMPSRGIEGRRLSYYNPVLGRRAGADAVVDPPLPDDCFRADELAVRVKRRFGSWEAAGYGYAGYWSTPEGTDPATGRPFHPGLNVYGGSLRGPVGSGIVNVEGAWYDSRNDRGGTDPLIRNSELRLLAGYETDLPDIAKDLTVGGQYYVEIMDDYNAYRDALPPGMHPGDRCRHVMTFRVTKLLMNQYLELSLFAYYSPSDGDAYLRPKIAYDIDDHWKVELGGNVFFGAAEHTFFNQFARNSNIYLSLRYGF